MKRVYIIGPVGSGKTTLAKHLSKKYNIPMYELDKVVWDDEHGNVKRTDAEISTLFHDIIKNKKWIIEDVGREKFHDGIINADIVYYINLSNITIYIRCVFRWIKQKIGLENYNYKPTIKSLIEMLGWAKNDLRNKNKKIKYIKEHSKKYKIISKEDINLMIK